MQENKTKWWNSRKGNVNSDLFGHVDYLDTHYGTRSEMNLMHLRLFGQSNLLGLSSDIITLIQRTERVSINIIRQVCEAAQAKIAKHQPKSRFLTDNSDSEKQQRAKKLEKFVTGICEHDDHYEKGKIDFLHSAVFGTVGRKFYVDHQGNPASETCMIENIKCDEGMQAIMNRRLPPALYEVRYMDKDEVKERFRVKEIICKDDAASSRFFTNLNTYGLMRVIEAWKLPTIPGAKNGRHVICINGQDLIDEKWTHDQYQHEFFQFTPNLLGFFGTGIPERLMIIQLEINKLLDDIHTIIHFGVPKIFAQIGTVDKNQLNNALCTLVEYGGLQPPQMAQLATVPKETLIQLAWLVQEGFREIGLSEMSAISVKPAGLNSGKAIREYSDVESERFSVTSQRWENYHLRCHKKYIWTAQLAAEKNKELRFKAIDGNGYEVIDWQSIGGIDELDFVQKQHASNLLSTSPAARLADVREMVDAGMISPQDGLDLLDAPDINKHVNMVLAPKRHLKKVFDHMIEKGNYLPPDQFQKLDLGVEIAIQLINYYRTVDNPPETVVLIEQWVSDAIAIQQQAEDDLNNELNAEAEEAMAMENMKGELAMGERAATSNQTPAGVVPA